MSVPDKMKALVENSAENGAEVQTIPVPFPDGNEVLVKIDYVAQNPTDWKHAQFISPAGSIIGCDFTGTIVATGGGETKHANHLKIGTRVAGCVHGGYYKDRGSFAQYAKVDADLCWPVPDGVKPEEAATFGVPFYTAFHALVDSQKAPWPPAHEKGWYLVYGGSSGVGLFTIQLAKLLGYKVVTTCSPANDELVKSYGADAVFDYHDESNADKIRELTEGSITKGLDCISITSSNAFAAKCFGDKGGVLNVILAPEAECPRKDVTLVPTLLYTWFGRAFEWGLRGQSKTPIPAIPQQREMHAELCRRAPELIAKHGFKAPPVKLRGGLEDIPAGFKEMAENKHSACRLVYKIDH